MQGGTADRKNDVQKFLPKTRAKRKATTLLLFVVLLSSVCTTPTAAKSSKAREKDSSRASASQSGFSQSGKSQSGSSQPETKPPVFLEGNVVTRVEQVTEDGAGPHEVEVAEGIVISDAEREKSIGIEVCYPKSNGRFPVIVFSHGSIASARDYRPLAAYWASHGYVCVMPTHDDALALHTTPGSKVSVVKLIKLARVTKGTIVMRQLDIAKSIDALPALPGKVDGLSEKIDTEHIAVVGHHAGAYAAQISAGATIGRANKSKDFDSRVKAVIAIDAVKDWWQPDLKKDALDSVTLPIMEISFNLYGDSLNSVRRRLHKAMDKAPSGNKYVVIADVIGDMGQPSRAKVRQAVKNSNVELVSFHPLKSFFSLFTPKPYKPAKTLSSQEQIRLAKVDETERVGANVLSSLGLTSLLPVQSEKAAFNFMMSFTLPFLDGYLKDDKAALEKLNREDKRAFGDTIVTTVERY